MRENAYKHIMSGTSKSFPLLVYGSLLLAIMNTTVVQEIISHELHIMFVLIGKGTVTLFLVFLASSIAVSISDESSFALGIVLGVAAYSLGGGVLGSIVSGYLVGFSMKFYKKTKRINRWRPLEHTVLIPLFIGGFLLVVYSSIFSNLILCINRHTVRILTNLPQVLCFILGGFSGVMMIIDMGGPINKSTALILNALYLEDFYLSASIKMAGGMIAPLGIGLALVLIGKRKEGRNLVFFGSLFITESLIPLFEEKRRSVLVSSIVGTFVSTGLIAVRGIDSIAIQGGLIVALLMKEGFLYLLLILMGAFISMLVFLICEFFAREKRTFDTETLNLEDYKEDRR